MRARLARYCSSAASSSPCASENVADPLIRHRKIALEADGARLGGGQSFSDGKPVAIRFQRLGEISLRYSHVADLVVGGQQAALIADLVWALVGEPGEKLLRLERSLLPFAVSPSTA